MMISKTMNAKLNAQITAEFGAAHKYLAMACALDQMGLKVLRKRFEMQSAEEREHAEKIIKYVLEVGGKVVLDSIDKPPANYKDAQAVVEAGLESELAVTKMVNDLMALAEKEVDFATQGFLQWFVDEQVEEVATMRDLLNLIKLAKGNMLQVEARLRHEMDKEAN